MALTSRTDVSDAGLARIHHLQVSTSIAGECSFVSKCSHDKGDDLDISGPTSEGRMVSLNERRGHPVAVVFWASWCKYCRHELLHLEEIQRQYEPQGLKIFGVNADKNTAEFLAFCRQRKISWSNIHYGSQTGRPSANPLIKRYELHRLPAIYLVNREGKVTMIGSRGNALDLQVKQLVYSENAVAESRR